MPDGDIMRPNYLTKNFAKWVEGTKLERIRFHDLRHTHATYLLSIGAHPKTVSERLGPSSIEKTLNLYSHVIPSLQAEAANLLEKDLFKKGVSKNC